MQEMQMLRIKDGENAQREKYIDVAKGIGILLVVYGHVINSGGLESLGVVSQVIYSFHMPLFFFVTGYLAGLRKYNSEFSFLKQLKKIGLSLFLPYIVWSFVYMYIGGALENLERYKAVFTLRGIAPLWFLAALGLCEVVFFAVLYLARKLSEGKGIALFVALGVLSLLAGFVMEYIKVNFGLSSENPGVATYYIFVTVARFFLSFPMVVLVFLFAKAGVLKKLGKVWSLLLGLVLMGVVVAVTMLTDLKVNMHTFEISNLPLFVAVAFGGSIGVMMLSFSVEKFSTALSLMGQYSLGIMILHYMPFKALKYSVELAGALWSNEIFTSLFATALTLGVSFLGIYLIKKKFFLKVTKRKAAVSVCKCTSNCRLFSYLLKLIVVKVVVHKLTARNPFSLTFLLNHVGKHVFNISGVFDFPDVKFRGGLVGGAAVNCA